MLVVDEILTRAKQQTRQVRGVGGQALKLPLYGEGCERKAMVANRTREIRLSGSVSSEG